MKNTQKTPLAIAIGTTLLSGLAATAVQAETQTNPFAMTDLDSGYMQLAAADSKDDSSKVKDGSCGEGKCGGKMMEEGAAEKMVEGACAGNKPMPTEEKGTEAKCGEAKCGEGKCGVNKS